MSMEPSITYLGWSGFRIDSDAGPIYIDPPWKIAFPSGDPFSVFLSHGHPEHVLGIRSHLKGAPSAANVAIFSSDAIYRYLRNSSSSAAPVFLPILPGDAFGLRADAHVSVFEWKHLPLLPGGLVPNIAHMIRLASKPILALRIALAGLLGPAAGPMMGFQIDVRGWRILAYGEGLHRYCTPKAIGETPQRTVALVGVEPGDEPVIPGLLKACGVGVALLYEPHANWRRAFGMSRVDLAALRDRITAAGINTEILVVQRRFLLEDSDTTVE
jgi:hypothetical protein